MARLLLLCLVLCCYLANTSAARNLLMSLDRPTSDLSTLASAPSPTTPENGRDNTANAPSSSGGGRGVAAAASPSSFTVLDKNGGWFATASRVEEASGAGQQRQGHRSSSNPVGGDVIVGGLATAFLAAIVCYIRVTRRRDDEEIQEKV